MYRGRGSFVADWNLLANLFCFVGGGPLINGVVNSAYKVDGDDIVGWNNVIFPFLSFFFTPLTHPLV
jgi:hypothetical protein